MTEQDPRATFNLDQAEAASEQATRDQQAYAMQVRQAEAHASLTEGQAAAQEAWAAQHNAIAGTVALLGFVVALHGLKRLVTRR